MLLQVLSLSPEQVNALDPGQRQSIVQLVSCEPFLVPELTDRRGSSFSVPLECLGIDGTFEPALYTMHSIHMHPLLTPYSSSSISSTVACLFLNPPADTFSSVALETASIGTADAVDTPLSPAVIGEAALSRGLDAAPTRFFFFFGSSYAQVGMNESTWRMSASTTPRSER